MLVLWFSVHIWQWSPAVFFVSYLLYGLVRPWVSRRMRQQIEIENEEPEDEIVLAEETEAEGERDSAAPGSSARSI